MTSSLDLFFLVIYAFVMDLAELRKSQGLTREDLARLVATTATTIYRLETGRHAPSFGVRERIDRWARKAGKTLTWRGRRA